MQSRPVYNQLWLGLLLGTLIPFIAFLFFFISNKFTTDFTTYINSVAKMSIMSGVLSLCALPNLLIFFIFIWRNLYYSARGVIFATMIWAIIVFIAKFAL